MPPTVHFSPLSTWWEKSSQQLPKDGWLKTDIYTEILAHFGISGLSGSQSMNLTEWFSYRILLLKYKTFDQDVDGRIRIFSYAKYCVWV